MTLIVTKPFDWAHRGVEIEHFEAGRDIADQTPDLIEVAEREGWAESSEGGSAKVPGKASDGLKIEEIKAALAEKGIQIPEGMTLKADLAALLDAGAQ